MQLFARRSLRRDSLRVIAQRPQTTHEQEIARFNALQLQISRTQAQDARRAEAQRNDALWAGRP
jgi:hypothetical protein